MKTRSGFVSNSSSSSFVVAFKTVPKNEEELKAMLFGKIKTFHSPYNDDEWPVETVAGYVWHDMKGKKPLTLTGIAKVFGEGHLAGNPESDEFKHPTKRYTYCPIDRADNKRRGVCGANIKFKEGQVHLKCPECESEFDVEPRRVYPETDWAAWERAGKRYCTERAKEFAKENKGSKFYRFEYADEEGSLGSAMEHGGLFDNLEFVRISKH